MASPAEDIALFLQAETFGTFGTNIFVSEEPISPNNCITIYDTGGNGDLVQDVEMSQKTFQVRVRNTSYQSAYALQEAVRKALAISEISFISNGHRYIGVWVQSDIISLGRDANNRYILTANYRTKRQPE